MANFIFLFLKVNIGYFKIWFVGQVGNYECIKTETVGEKKNVGLITLNRPKALNALCEQVITELNHALEHFNTDSSISAIVITGNEKAFAAGKIILWILLYIDLLVISLITFNILSSHNYTTHIIPAVLL